MTFGSVLRIRPTSALRRRLPGTITALNEARKWKEFRVRLCPSLAGIVLLKDGGFLTVQLDAEARSPAKFQFHALPR